MCKVKECRKAWAEVKDAETKLKETEIGVAAVQYDRPAGRGGRHSSPVEVAAVKREAAAGEMIAALAKYAALWRDCNRIIDRIDNITLASFLSCYADGVSREDLMKQLNVKQRYFYHLQAKAFSAFDELAAET